MNNFDDLAKLALNEGTLSDYMNAVKRASNAAAKKPIGTKLAKGVIKGAAAAPGRVIQGLGKLGQLAGSAIKGAGAVYGALGGTQGAALANKVGGAVSNVGGTVSKVGSAIAKAPQKASDAIRQYGRNHEYNRAREAKEKDTVKNLKLDIKRQFPRLDDHSYALINKATTYKELDSAIKQTIPKQDLDSVQTAYWKYSPRAKAEDDKKENEIEALATQPQVPSTANQPNTTSQQTPAVPMTKGSTQTKAGIPIKPPTKADVASMNLPSHPLHSRSPVNRRK